MAPELNPVVLTDSEFLQFQRFIYDAAGISLSSAKRALVSGRLANRIRDCKLKSYGEYLRLLASGQAPAEVQTAIDLLTTNETYFFREPKHFELLQRLAGRRNAAGEFRVWSAASSTGEEAYSIAMVLADCLGPAGWSVVGSDISRRVLERAHTGHYSLARAEGIPANYLKRFCLRGVGEQNGTLLISRELRSRVSFLQVNLNCALPRLGAFDVIFLRNAMIYFDDDTKREVVARVLSQLKPGGHFLIGHSESLHGITEAVQPVRPSIYQKPMGRPSIGP